MRQQLQISTETGSFGKYYDNFETLKKLKEAGFNAYDFTMCGEPGKRDMFFYENDYIDRAKKLKKQAEEQGLICNQTHAPFPTVVVGNEEYNRKTYKDIVRAIEISGALGARLCVVHPCNYYTPEQNAEIYRRFESVAKDNGVLIALENMWNWTEKENHALPAACSDGDNFLKHLELLDDKVFVACLDLGHAEMFGLNTSAIEMIKKLGNRIKALHIHDNDLHDDLHLAPFMSKMKFEPIFSELKGAGYNGDVTFEANGFLGKLPKEVFLSGLKYLLSAGQYLRELLQY